MVQRSLNTEVVQSAYFIDFSGSVSDSLWLISLVIDSVILYEHELCSCKDVYFQLFRDKASSDCPDIIRFKLHYQLLGSQVAISHTSQ